MCDFRNFLANYSHVKLGLPQAQAAQLNKEKLVVFIEIVVSTLRVPVNGMMKKWASMDNYLKIYNKVNICKINFLRF